MRVIHHGGFTHAERNSYREVLFGNTIQGMQVVLEALATLETRLQPSDHDFGSFIEDLDPHAREEDLRVPEAIAAL